MTSPQALWWVNSHLEVAVSLAPMTRPADHAATMLGQAKTAIQAEIDAACELIDFIRCVYEKLFEYSIDL